VVVNASNKQSKSRVFFNSWPRHHHVTTLHTHTPPSATKQIWTEKRLRIPDLYTATRKRDTTLHTHIWHNNY